MKENNPHILGTEKVGKLLLEYSIPAIIGMTLTSLYNIIDSVFIGPGLHFALYYSYGTNKADVLHYSVDGLNNFGFRLGVSF